MNRHLLLDLLRRHATGDRVGITSVCSAHPVVIEAALRQGKQDESVVLIEATCNQVNHEGGYTGMTPSDFRAFAEGTGSGSRASVSSSAETISGRTPGSVFRRPRRWHRRARWSRPS
jgi:tagatose-1,6-bisphosphate aldolase non-catalytic subunit AgaZ/GatZ